VSDTLTGIGGIVFKNMAGTSSVYFEKGFCESTWSPVIIKKTSINYDNIFEHRGFMHSLEIQIFNYTSREHILLSNLLDILNADDEIIIFPHYNSLSIFNVSYVVRTKSLIKFESDFKKAQLGETFDLVFYEAALASFVTSVYQSELQFNLLINSSDNLAINSSDKLKITA